MHSCSVALFCFVAAGFFSTMSYPQQQQEEEEEEEEQLKRLVEALSQPKNTHRLVNLRVHFFLYFKKNI